LYFLFQETVLVTRGVNQDDYSYTIDGAVSLAGICDRLNPTFMETVNETIDCESIADISFEYSSKSILR